MSWSVATPNADNSVCLPDLHGASEGSRGGDNYIDGNYKAGEETATRANEVYDWFHKVDLRKPLQLSLRR